MSSAAIEPISAPAGEERIRHNAWPQWGIALLYLLATYQTVLYYMVRSRPYVRLLDYENGTAHMPFQGRLLMALLLRSVRHNRVLTAVAHGMSSIYPWFPRHLKAESIVEAAVNVACLLLAGAVATRIYKAASPRKLFVPYIYPLVLVIFTATYVLHITQNLRFVYDLPSLGFFSAGLYLIYFRRSTALFAAVFLVGTINRETTLVLLPCYALAYAAGEGKLEWRKLFASPVLRVILPLAACWAAWHLFVFHIYAKNPSEYYSRSFVNTGFLLIPLAWPQVFCACAYLLPVICLLRKRLHDPVLRAWMWMLPIWMVLMYRYGMLIETRIFGELTPYVACTAALIAEQLVLEKLGLPGDVTALPVDC